MESKESVMTEEDLKKVLEIRTNLSSNPVCLGYYESHVTFLLKKLGAARERVLELEEDLYDLHEDRCWTVNTPSFKLSLFPDACDSCRRLFKQKRPSGI